ncbi:hypothetical protein PVAP13_7KG252100 [Panicum virgatum]|uniref:Uncharacterized protein n=1 Tax=Panicum virgatum TaxID=38727 RepID=A0A8T0QPD3_PANVG|nr:hypothetical protein PVAP13_7KG252100 [Panicum virgatum]
MENGGGWSRSEMEYSQHMRVGPVRQNLADEFDPRGFRPSRDGRRLLPRLRHRRGGRSGGAQFRVETGRGGSSFSRRPVLPPPLPLQADGGAEGRVDPTAARRCGGGQRRVRPPAHLRSIRRALAASSGAGRAGEEGRFRRDLSLRSRSPAVAPSDSAVNGNQPRGPERASSAGPQAQELCPDVPRVRVLRLVARPSRPVPIDYAGDLNLQVVVLQMLDQFGKSSEIEWYFVLLGKILFLHEMEIS